MRTVRQPTARPTSQPTSPARRSIWRLAALGCWTPALLRAAAVPEADARAVRQVVEAQLAAFAADDAERAFSYASAAIRAQFGNARNFMAMVRGSYPMVVRPSGVSFFLPEADDSSAGAVQQAVQLRDSAGRLWRAVYLLERQGPAGWRIGGCVVAADGGQSST